MSSRPLCIVMLSIAKHPVTVLIALSSRPCAGISLHITLRKVIPAFVRRHAEHSEASSNGSHSVIIPALCRDQLTQFQLQIHPPLQKRILFFVAKSK